jgi:anti-anti-sigma regulatory factor
MGIEIDHYPDEERIDLTLRGNLDLTLTGEILDVCRLVERQVSTCVIDSTRVERVFDSGIGLLMMLSERLQAADATLILIGEIPGLPASVVWTPVDTDVGPVRQVASAGSR